MIANGLDNLLCRHFITKRRPIKTIEHLLTLTSPERQQLLRHLTEEEFEDVITVAKRMPLIDMDVNYEGESIVGTVVLVSVGEEHYFTEDTRHPDTKIYNNSTLAHVDERHNASSNKAETTTNI